MDPEWIGYIAAILTTTAYVPQAVKVIRHRHTQSLSLVMYILMTSGITCWLIYGWMLGSPSLMLANGITVVLTGTILVMKIRYG